MVKTMDICTQSGHTSKESWAFELLENLYMFCVFKFYEVYCSITLSFKYEILLKLRIFIFIL